MTENQHSFSEAAPFLKKWAEASYPASVKTVWSQKSDQSTKQVSSQNKALIRKNET